MSAFSIYLITCILTSAIKGFSRGWKKGLVMFCRALVAALISYVLVFSFCRLWPAGSMFETIFGSFIQDIEIVSESEYIHQMAGSLIYTVVMPFVFLILFFIFNALLMIPARIIERKLGIKTKKQLKEIRKAKKAAKKAGEDYEDEYPDIKEPSTAAKILSGIGGSVLRGLTTTLIIVLILMPFTGIIYTFTDGIVNIADTASEVDASVNIGSSNMTVLGHKLTDEEGKLNADEVDLLVHETLDPVRNNFFLKLSHIGPTETVYNGFSGSRNVDGKIRNEITQVFDLVCDAVYLTVDMEDYGEPQKDAVERIFAYVSKSDLHCGMASDVLSGVAKRVLNNETVFGIDLEIIKKEPASIATMPLLEILANTTPETVIEDVNTLRDVIIIMIDYGIPGEIALAISEGNRAYAPFANEELIYEILVTTYHTDDYRHMTGPVINLMFTVFTRGFDPEAGIADVAGENIENLTDDDLRAEAKIFCDLIGSINSVLDSVPALTESENTISAVVNANMESLGEFVDKARESQFVGEGVTELIIVILESDTMDSMRDVADIMVKHIKYDEELDMSNLFVAVQGFVSILDQYENGTGHDTASLAKALGDLNKTFEGDPNTAKVMKEIINETNMINSSSLSSGGEENNSSQKMMTVFIDQLASKEFTEEELEHEAKALDYSMQLIQASGQDDSAEQLKEVYTGEKMNEMIDVMTDSQITSAAINEIAYDENGNKTEDALELSNSMDAEDRAEFINQCQQTYNNKLDAFMSDPSKTDDDIAEYKNTLQTNMSSLASVFGETLDFDSWDASRAE